MTKEQEEKQLKYIEYLVKENERQKKKLEEYEQIFWDNNNEIARLKRRIDKMKNKRAKNNK